ncbi:serine/arginine-rich splicing factor 11 isoform X2 [Ictalurus punctatus]|uniref:Serine/arginine-rich splicing factor 11 isoform X2 n=1 Tax=Ictalurus punctatus TaxID=7998 RepID=A0A2D0RTV5_ICTPU|nr:serine/arginine-rich splicing factor 11 isoform X2 [Ictalurus punctatus]
MSSSTKVVQVTNVSPSATSEQMRTLFGFLGNIDELKLFPPDDSPLPVTSRVCFVKFLESESVGVSQHLTNTVFVDRALIVVPFAEGVIPDESKALSLMAPANAVAGMLPGGGLLPTPSPVPSIGGVPLGSLGGPGMDAMAALGIPGPNMNPQSLSAEQIMKFMASMDPNVLLFYDRLNPLAAGLNLNAGLKTDASNKEIEEAMKRVREAQSLISAAIEPGNKKDDKRKHSRSRSRSRKKRSRSRSKYRRSKSRSRRQSRSRSKRRSKSPRRRRSHSKDKRRRSRSRDRKKRSKTPPKSYSSGRRSRSSSHKRHRRSRSISHSPKKSRSPKRRLSRSPSPRRHKKEKKKDKERERDRDRKEDQNREKRERSTSKKSKDKEKERDRKSDGEKSDVKVIRDYDEEEQGYDSEREEEREGSPDMAASPHATDDAGRGESDQHSDEQQDEDMDMSD